MVGEGWVPKGSGKREQEEGAYDKPPGFPRIATHTIKRVVDKSFTEYGLLSPPSAGGVGESQKNR